MKIAAVARCDIPAVFVQVWASSFLPNEPALAERCQREYKQLHGEPMLLQYAHMEAQAQSTGDQETLARTAEHALWYSHLALHYNNTLVFVPRVCRRNRGAR
ncbi:galactose-1-phosphate uridylyltransferase [Tachysurus ichikawai]